MSGDLNRRTLFKLGAVGAVASTGFGCAPPVGKTADGEANGERMRVPDFELDEVGVAELQRGMEEGRWSAREITELYLGRSTRSIVASAAPRPTRWAGGFRSWRPAARFWSSPIRPRSRRPRTGTS